MQSPDNDAPTPEASGLMLPPFPDFGPDDLFEPAGADCKVLHVADGVIEESVALREIHTGFVHLECEAFEHDGVGETLGLAIKRLFHTGRDLPED